MYPVPAVGERFGRWTVTGEQETVRGRRRYIACRCDCGKDGVVYVATLVSMRNTGCGCRRTGPRATPVRAAERIGQTFHHLTIVSLESMTKGGQMVRVACDCGGEKVCLLSNVVSGQTRSCGCARESNGARIWTDAERAMRGIWSNMLARCHDASNHSFGSYGGRGISVCAQWRESFRAFLADMGPRPSPKHSIDRIDNDGNYTPANCRWATWIEQARNTRRNVWLEHNGERMLMTDWAARLGISRERMRQRVAAGMPPERLFAIKCAPVPPVTLEYRGVTRTVAEWAALRGMSEMTIRGRIKRGLPAERVLSKGPARRTTKGMRYRCRECGEAGHNARTCDHVIRKAA